MKLDQIDTPPAIARKMIAMASFDGSGIAADFSAGGGALLEQVEKRWPSAQVVGIDVCRSRVMSLRRCRPGWKIGVADFLNPRSRAQCHALKNLKDRVSAIFLNPPFSCRGAHTKKVEYDGEQIASSTAMGFVLQSLNYLHPFGEMIAVLPAGILSAEKDRKALRKIAAKFSMSILETCDSRSFEGFFVRTVIARIASQVASPSNYEGVRRVDSDCRYSVNVVRGTVPMHKLNSEAGFDCVPLIHTTALAGNKLRQSPYRVDKIHAVQGPMVLIPRVGEPSARKVVVVGHESSVALSDCVIALKCCSLDQAFLLYSSILQDWGAMSQLYGGTCARYITLDRVAKFLESIGFQACIGKQTGVLRSEVESPKVELQA